MFPLRVDTIDRLVHLSFIIKYIAKGVDAQILICESDNKPIAKNYQTFNNILKDFKVRYYFVEDTTLFSMSKITNFMINNTTTEFVMLHPCDVIFPDYTQYSDSINLLLNGYHFIWPFKLFITPGKFLTDKLISNSDFSLITKEYYLKHKDLFDNPPQEFFIGAGHVFNKNYLMNIGGFNENLVGWGHEDLEIKERLIKMGSKIAYLQRGLAVHLKHDRISNFNSNGLNNRKEYNRIKKMTTLELENEIKSWKWRIPIIGDKK